MVSLSKSQIENFGIYSKMFVATQIVDSRVMCRCFEISPSETSSTSVELSGLKKITLERVFFWNNVTGTIY